MQIKKNLTLLFTSIALFSSMTIFPKADDIKSPSIVSEDSLLSDYAYIVDIDNGQVLLDKNSEAQMYPASLTKMMTCIVAMENLTDLNQTVLITDQMLAGLYEAEASVAGLVTGDEPTVEDLFYCSALPSGADASNALAYTVSGSVEAYVKRMNEEAQKIGMTHTHFVNVTGLHDPNHYSTAKDMCKLLQYCLQNEEFVKVFSTKEYTTHPLASSPEGLEVYSTTALYEDNSGFSLNGLIGSKTGYTEEAERCLAYWADVNDIEIAAVTAHAVQSDEHLWPHIEDASTVLNSLSTWQKKQIAQQGETLKSITVKHMFGNIETVDIQSPDTIVLDLPADSNPVVEESIDNELNSSYEEQSVPVTICVKLNDQTIYAEDTSIEIPADPNFLARFFKRIRSLF